MKKLVYIFLSFYSLLSVHEAFAQVKTKSYLYDPGAIAREHNLDYERMVLQVAFEPEKGLVKGEITHFFSPIRDKVDTFFLDGPGITVKEAILDGNAIKFKTNESGITFFADKTMKYGEKHNIKITYEAYPRKGIYFIGWNDPDSISRKQIWTQGQGTDNRYWFPCYDTQNDKLITELIVSFDSRYKVLSNGTKLSEKVNKNNTTTWHYKMTHPHTTYLVMLGIGKYDIKESKSKSGVPMSFWYYPEWKNRLEPTYMHSEKIFDFLENEIGVPYPWESYSQIPVQDFMYGAMENTTATLFGDFFHIDSRGYLDKNYVAVNAHELAHQWFGDLVTARSSNHHWLQESFATHYNIIAERECFGNDHFDWVRRQSANTAINITDKKPIAFVGSPSPLVYQKGSQILEMLKYVTGRESYNRSIKRYLLEKKYANVDSEDLLNAFHDELGLSLDWFWDEWIYRGTEPAYEVKYEALSTADKKSFIQFTVNQTQAINDVNGLFKMPIQFEVHYTDGTIDSKTEWIEKESHTINIDNKDNKKIDFVLFDPNDHVVKTVSFEKPLEMLKAQALRAPNMLDRYDAVLAMKNISNDLKRNTLQEVYNKNTFHGIKSEVINQLLDDDHETSLETIKKALKDNDAQVRKALITNTKTIKLQLVKEYESLLLDSSYQTIAVALEKLCFSFPDNTNKYLELTKGIEGNLGRNVIIKWLEISAGNSSDKKFTDQLVTYTTNSYEFLTRINAMAALRKLNYFDEKLLENCLSACMSSNTRLANPAGETIKHFYAQNKYKKNISDKIKTKNLKEWEKEIVAKLMQ